MITGELDYSDAFGLSYDGSNDTAGIPRLLYPETANFVWVIFLIFIPILLSNMLVRQYLHFPPYNILACLFLQDWLGSRGCNRNTEEYNS